MKNSILVFAFLFLIASQASSQWYKRNIDSLYQLNSVYFADANTGWAVGLIGQIVKTTDGGNSWQDQSIANTNFLTSVHFINSNTGFAVGLFGMIVGTSNGGNTWANTINTNLNDLLSIQFVNSFVGWSVGRSGTILKTTTGGLLWTTQTSNTTEDLLGAFFVSSTTGWAVGTNGTILKTTNGGTSWLAQTSNTAQPIAAVHFANSTTGFAVGGMGTILKTTNGGATWLAQTSGTINQLTSVRFVNSSTGWAVGVLGTILHTSNGGTTWTDQSIDAIAQITSVFFTSANSGCVVGWGGRIYRYSNAPPSQPVLSMPMNNSLNTPLSTKLVWNESDYSLSYRLQVSTDNAFTNIIKDTTTSQTSDSVFALSANTTYYWRVRAYNTIDSSAWSLVWNFTTQSQQQTTTQSIDLSSGWNMFSRNVTLNNKAFSAVLQQIAGHFTQVKNASGQIYMPPFFNSLTQWDSTQAYQIHIISPTILVLNGEIIDPQNTPINFAATGWHWIPYLRQAIATPATALASINGMYSQVKSIQGEIFMPPFFNSLQQLKPGAGYFIYITQQTQLLYPQN